MFLTHEVLMKYNPCKEGIDWFDRHYPNGAELIDVIRTRHVPAQFLHWGRLNLTTNQEERRAYDEVLHVTDSTNYWECQNVDHCNMISKCTDTKASNYIYESSHVENSEDVDSSSTITNSTTISHSSYIYNSTKIVYSNNIKNSVNVTHSSYIIDSNNIKSSSLITDSAVVMNSKNIEKSGFIIDSSDLVSSLFCIEQKGGKFLLFNKPINESQWEFIYTEFKDMMESRCLHLFDSWDKEDIGHTLNIYYTSNHIFSTVLDSAMINWIKHLPYFDGNMMYRMTFHPDFLD